MERLEFLDCYSLKKHPIDALAAFVPPVFRQPVAGKQAAENVCDQGDAGAFVATEGEKDTARRASKNFEIICRVAMPIEHHAVGNGVFFSYSLLNFSHAHGCGGEVENDMPAVSRRNAEGHGMGDEDTSQSGIQSRRERIESDQAPGYRHR